MSLGESQVTICHCRDATVSSHTKEISLVTVLISPRGNVPAEPPKVSLYCAPRGRAAPAICRIS